MLDKEDKLFLVCVGSKMDNDVAEISSLQFDDEVSYNLIWQDFIGKELIQQSLVTTKKCLL